MGIMGNILHYSSYFIESSAIIIGLNTFSNYISCCKIFFAADSEITTVLGSFKAVFASPAIIGSVNTSKSVESA
jgi:hypothetical protein